MKLKGKRILVTGGASGYGYGMAKCLSVPDVTIQPLIQDITPM